MATFFFLEVLSHAKDRDILPRFFDQLCKRYRSSEDACRWLVTLLIDNEHILSQFLLEAPVEEVLLSTSYHWLQLFSVEAVSPSRSDHALLSSSPRQLKCFFDYHLSSKHSTYRLVSATVQPVRRCRQDDHFVPVRLYFVSVHPQEYEIGGSSSGEKVPLIRTLLGRVFSLVRYPTRFGPVCACNQ